MERVVDFVRACVEREEMTNSTRNSQKLLVSPKSEPLFQYKDAASVQTFFACMNVQHDVTTSTSTTTTTNDDEDTKKHVLQHVVLGDMCLFSTCADDPAQMKMKNNRLFGYPPFKVGQIVSLQTCKSVQEGLRQKIHQATVRWFWYPKSQLYKQKAAHITPPFRPEVSLLESDVIETLDLSQRLLPGLVVLQEKSAFSQGEIPPQCMAPGTWEMYFTCCNQRLLHLTNDQAAAKLDKQLHALSEYTNNNNTTTCPPAAVQRAWKEVSPHQHFLEQQRKGLAKSWHRFTQMPRFVYQDDDGDDNDDEEEEPMDKENDQNSTHPTKKKQTTTRARQAVVPHNKKRMAKAAPSKRARPKRSQQPASKKRPRRSKTTTTSQQNDGICCAEQSRLVNDSSTPKAVVPLSQILYSLRRYKKPKRLERHFYSGVELNVLVQQAENCEIGFSTDRWTLQVGDLIAVRSSCCGESSSRGPPKGRRSAASKEWFPFGEPWSPSQVLSIFRDEGSDDGDYFMELRLFHRPGDLEEEVDFQNFRPDLDPEKEREIFGRGKLSGRVIVEVDELVSTVAVKAALGRIVTTSVAKPHHKWLNKYVDADGVPQLPMICRYLYQRRILSSDLNVVRDWSEYRSHLAGPLSRGLLCEKATPGTNTALRRVYEKALRDRFKLEDNIHLNLIETTIEKGVPTCWQPELLQCVVVDHDKSRVLHSVRGAPGSSREFLLSVMIPVAPQRYQPHTFARTSSVDRKLWKLQIGDAVCIAKNDVPPSENSNNKNPWSPFVGPWRIGQVVSIYRNVVKNGSAIMPLLEVRWFLRRSDVPSCIANWMPPEIHSTREEEHFESDVLEQDIPASHVLGKANFLLGNNSISFSTPSSHNVVEMPAVSCRSRYFFVKSLGHFQPLWGSSLTSKDWFQCMQERGFRLSALVREHPELSDSIRFCLPRSNISTAGTAFAELLKATSSTKPPEAPMFCRDLPDNTRYFFLSISVLPQWKLFALSDLLFLDRDRADMRWTARVGDLVALRGRCKQSSDMEVAASHPFTVPWKAAQILAIYSDAASTDKTDDYKELTIEVRWLKRRCELPNQALSSSPGLGVLYEASDSCEIGSVGVDELLGPVALCASHEMDLDENGQRALWESIPIFLPVAPYTYGGELHWKEQTPLKQACSTRERLAGLTERALRLSSAYGEEHISDVLEKLRSTSEVRSRGSVQRHLQLFLERKSPSCPSSPETFFSNHSISSASVTDTRLSVKPFHTDLGSGIEYYSSIDVTPPYDVCAVSIPDRSNTLMWTVKLGDPVVLHYKNGFGRTSFGDTTGIKSGLQTFPFSVPWAVGEVVTILKRTKRNAGVYSNGTRLEIRWFYREVELPGTIRNRSKPKCTFECETIFESDHYDEIDASSLIAPIKLYEEDRQSERQWHLGMPTAQFICNRFWSLRGKSLIPTTGLEGRVARARVHSKHFGIGTALRSAYEALSSTGLQRLPQPSVYPHSRTGNWRDAFQRVIKKLSLTDASKEGFENGAMLIGREKERKQLRLFLRGAITGDMREGSKPSLFVAGPPGVGKTACIHSVVNDLRREKTKDRIPDFDFISLNGMEMRNPFEAYVKLWQSLTAESSNCSPESAARNLEAYFSNKSNESRGTCERVTFVLLDEIDYLVTPKQTVLYNFFDWPNKALETGSNRRLVVVGISNTLNLRDRLQPRVQSRISSDNIYFKAYGVDQTVAILSAKLKQASPHYQVFDADALLFASKKIAALSGDIRKAFFLCRTSAETILYKSDHDGSSATQPIVHIKDVLESCKESFNSGESKSISLCTSFEALLLISLAALRKSTGREVGGFDLEEILAKMDSMAKSFGDRQYLPPPSLRETLGILARLAETQIIAMETPREASISYRASLAGSGGAWPLVTMVPDDTALLIALKKTKHSKLAQKHLATFKFS